MPQFTSTAPISVTRVVVLAPFTFTIAQLFPPLHVALSSCVCSRGQPHQYPSPNSAYPRELHSTALCSAAAVEQSWSCTQRGTRRPSVLGRDSRRQNTTAGPWGRQGTGFPMQSPHSTEDPLCASSSQAQHGRALLGHSMQGTGTAAGASFPGSTK